VHVIAAAVGISSLLVSSATAFTAVKIAGAVYLVGLGLKTLLSGRGEPLDAPEGDAPHPLRLYRDGVVVNVLNPKTALFFLAFLPQFVDPERGAVALQAVVLGLLFVSIALVSDSLYALAASAARGALRGSAALARARRWVSGSVLVLLGAATAKAT
jgi:threonine/homoserine/homoserine lactone efflux protein